MWLVPRSKIDKDNESGNPLKYFCIKRLPAVAFALMNIPYFYFYNAAPDLNDCLSRLYMTDKYGVVISYGLCSAWSRLQSTGAHSSNNRLDLEEHYNFTRESLCTALCDTLLVCGIFMHNTSINDSYHRAVHLAFTAFFGFVRLCQKLQRIYNTAHNRWGRTFETLAALCFGLGYVITSSEVGNLPLADKENQAAIAYYLEVCSLTCTISE